MDSRATKPCFGNSRSRLIALFLLSALVLIPELGAASPWPALPPEAPLNSPDPGFKFAAGLYNSQEALKDTHNTNMDKVLLARSYISSSRLSDALLLLDEGMLPPRDLALQFDLARESGMDISKEAAWLAAFKGGDGESLFWQARLAEKLGKNSESRLLYEKLLRERPSSVFVPVSQERLASLPFEDLPPLVKVPVYTDGFRIQWGVFREASRARQMKSVLEAYGHVTEIAGFEREGIPLNRVISEPFATREEARREGDSIRSRYGLDYVIFEESSSP